MLAPAFKELSDQEMAALEAYGDQQLNEEGEEGEASTEGASSSTSSSSSVEMIPDSTYLSKHAVLLDTMKKRIEQLKEDYQRSTSANKSSKSSKSSHKSSGNHKARSKSGGGGGGAAAAANASPKPPVQGAQGL